MLSLALFSLEDATESPIPRRPHTVQAVSFAQKAVATWEFPKIGDPSRVP